MRLRYAVLGSLLALILPSAPAVAEAPLAFPDSDRAADCQSADGWVSRDFALALAARRDCLVALPGPNQKMRVSHLRRGGLAGSGGFADPFALAPTPGLDVAAVDETRSGVKLDGSWSRWRYETKFELGRAAHLASGRFEPEDRSELRFKTSVDLGILRPGVELREAIAQEDPEIDRSFAVRRDSRSLAGGRAFVDVALPGGAPVLTFALGREQLDALRHLTPGDRTPLHDRTDSDFATGGLWFQRKSWQAFGSSSVYRFRNASRPGAPESKLYYHYLSGSYWPVPSLTINPTLHYSEASHGPNGSRIDTLAANLGVYSTGVGQNGLLTLWSGYTRSHDRAKSFDYEQVDVAVGVERAVADVARFGGYGISVGGSLGYSHYFDRLHPRNSGPGYRTLLTLRIGAAPRCAGRESGTHSCSVAAGI